MKTGLLLAVMGALARFAGAEEPAADGLEEARQLVRSEDAKTREAAAKKVFLLPGHLEEKEALLVLLLRDPVESVRWSAARYVQVVARTLPAVVTAALESEDRWVRGCGLNAIPLVQEPDRAWLPPVRKALLQGDSNAVMAIVRFRKDAAPALREGMASKNFTVRSLALSAAANIGAASEETLTILLDALKDPEPALREVAAILTASLDHDGATRCLIEEFRTGDDDVRICVAKAFMVTPVARRAEVEKALRGELERAGPALETEIRKTLCVFEDFRKFQGTAPK